METLVKTVAIGVALVSTAVVLVAFIADGPKESFPFLALVAGVVGIFVISFTVHHATERLDDLPDQS